MAKAHDLQGWRFGSLVAMRPCKETGPGGAKMWVCLCDCGRTRVCEGSKLKRGHATRCGIHHGEPVTPTAVAPSAIPHTYIATVRQGQRTWRSTWTAVNTAVVRRALLAGRPGAAVSFREVS